ncbi:hypothetical protein BDQ17DRAFT_1425186 [Cyathus striatus]|nr:hypothetical protein BDQ17DRAFT_1425186 [Cyathus striatus]
MLSGWGDPMSSTLMLPGYVSDEEAEADTSSGATGVPPIPTSSTSLSMELPMDSHHPFSVQGSLRKGIIPSPPKPPLDVLPSLPSSVWGRARLLLLDRVVVNPAWSVEQFAISAGEEDWDRIDSVTDLDAAARGLGINPDGIATVHGKKDERVNLDTHALTLSQQQQTPQPRASCLMFFKKCNRSNINPTAVVIRSHTNQQQLSWFFNVLYSITIRVQLVPPNVLNLVSVPRVPP